MMLGRTERREGPVGRGGRDFLTCARRPSPPDHRGESGKPVNRRTPDHGEDPRIVVRQGGGPGAAVVAGTNVPVWIVLALRDLGISDGEVRAALPGLDAGLLVAADRYSRRHHVALRSVLDRLVSEERVRSGVPGASVSGTLARALVRYLRERTLDASTSGGAVSAVDPVPPKVLELAVDDLCRWTAAQPVVDPRTTDEIMGYDEQGLP